MRRNRLRLVSPVFVDHSAVEEKGFQFLHLELSCPRLRDRRHLFSLFRLRCNTPVSEPARRSLRRPEQDHVHVGLDRAGPALFHVRLAEVREQRLPSGPRSAGLRMDGFVGLELVRESPVMQGFENPGGRRLRRR